MELATVGVAVTLTLEGERCRDVRIVLAAVAPTPLRATPPRNVAERPPIEALIREAAEAAESNAAIGDVRGSADYRRAMVGVLTRRALEQALEGRQVSDGTT